MKFILATNKNIGKIGRFAVIPHGVPEMLTGVELSLYLVFLEMASLENGQMFASQNTLAKRAGISNKSAQRAIPSLIEKGFVKEVVKGKSTGFATVYNVYRPLLVNNDIELEGFVDLDDLTDEERTDFFKEKLGMI